MLEKINLLGGKVVFNDFKIDLSKPACGQTRHLQEDLLQIKYLNRYVVDVGWLRMNDPKGFFWIRVIEDRDWDDPLFSIKITKLEHFIESLQKAIDFISKFIQENPDRPIRDSAID